MEKELDQAISVHNALNEELNTAKRLIDEKELSLHNTVHLLRAEIDRVADRITKLSRYKSASMEDYTVVEHKENMQLAYYTMFLMAHRDKLKELLNVYYDMYGDNYVGDSNLYMEIYNCGVEVWAEEWRGVGIADDIAEEYFIDSAIQRFEEKIK